MASGSVLPGSNYAAAGFSTWLFCRSFVLYGFSRVFHGFSIMGFPWVFLVLVHCCDCSWVVSLCLLLVCLFSSWLTDFGPYTHHSEPTPYRPTKFFTRPPGSVHSPESGPEKWRKPWQDVCIFGFLWYKEHETSHLAMFFSLKQQTTPGHLRRPAARSQASTTAERPAVKSFCTWHFDATGTSRPFVGFKDWKHLQKTKTSKRLDLVKCKQP